MPAISGGDAETPLATGLNTLLLHQLLDAQLAHAEAVLAQLAPDTRPSGSSSPIYIEFLPKPYPLRL